MSQSRQSRQPQTLASIGRQLSRVVKDEVAKPHAVDELLWAAARVEETDPQLTAKFMLTHLVPRCVAAASGDGHERVRSSQLRRLLVDWINSLPERTLWDVRRVVTESVIGSLKADPTFEGMYSLASIGYRSPEAIGILSALGERDDRLGHEALRLLLGFEPAPEVISWISKRIRDTPFEHRTEELLNAAAQTHNTAFLPFLADDAIRRGPGWFALARLLWVGQDSPGDRRTQDAVWRTIARVSRRWKDGRDHLAMTGGLVRSCHSPLALRAVLRAATVTGRPSPSRLLTQVAEAESPAQLEGWTGVSLGRVVGAVKSFVEVDTRHAGVGQTIESVNKDIALETLLSSGSPRTTDILTTAIANETNVYTTAELMRALSMFPVRSLPPRVTNALRDEPGFSSRSDENTRLVVYLAAARVAASARSFEAFDAVVQSRGLVNGHPLTVPVRGAVAQLIWLARSHKREGGSRLISGLESPSPLPQIVAAQALVSLLREEPIDEAKVRLIGLATNPDAMPYVRTAAIAAISVAAREQDDGDWRDVLVRLCEDPDEKVQYAAASALIDAGALQDASEVVERLALSEGDAARYRALLVGQLVAVDPERHVETARAIMSSEGDLLHAVLDGFQVGHRHKERSLPTALADAVVARVNRDESEVRSDAPLLTDLAELAPDRILTEAWPDVWHRWMPQSRCVLAEILPTAAQRVPGLQEEGVELLKRLIQDGSFAVRRSAARSLSRLREATLSEWCDEAYRSGSIHLRRLAIEGAAWLPSDSEASLDNAVVRMGRADAERTVRDAAERAGRDMRRRSWARSLLAEMKSGAYDDERHVHRQYRTSKALARVGDDEDLRALDTLRRDPACPPNVAYWFERTREELEKQWKKTTGEWPEPWRHWNAAVERVQGTLSAAGNDYVADLYLWHRRGKGAEGVSGWGGAGQVESMGHAMQLAHASGEITLAIEGRRSARALVVSITNSEIVLTGNGPYPSATHRSEDEGTA
jgi:HEAT repeat protein